MKGHNGTDLEAGVQNVYAAMDGTVIEMQTDARLGLGLGIISTQPLDLGISGTHYLKLRYWHLKSFNVTAGQNIKAGDLIGVSDNTGYLSVRSFFHGLLRTPFDGLFIG
jgi:murein DD-endopeptidase